MRLSTGSRNSRFSIIDAIGQKADAVRRSRGGGSLSLKSQKRNIPERLQNKPYAQLTFVQRFGFFEGVPRPTCSDSGCSQLRMTSPVSASMINSSYVLLVRSIIRLRLLHLPVFRCRSSPSVCSTSNPFPPGERWRNFSLSCALTASWTVSSNLRRALPQLGQGDLVPRV